MKNDIIRIAKLLAFLCGAILLSLPPAQVMGQTPETPRGKPALYEFGAGYCVSCKEMAKIMADLTITHSDQMEFRMIYADKEKELFQKYKVMLIPTQVFLDAQGKEVDRHMGALTKEEVLKKLKELKFIR